MIELELEIQTHLGDLKRSIKELDIDGTFKIACLLIKYQEIFATNDLDLGCLNTGDPPTVPHKMQEIPY